MSNKSLQTDKKYRNLPPNKWFCLTNFHRCKYNEWIYFKDLSDEMFIIVWNEIEQRPNLILNEEGTAFKKTSYINFNRLNENVI